MRALTPKLALFAAAACLACNALADELTDVPALLRQAERLASQGRHADAEQALARAAAEAPDVESIRFRLAGQMAVQRNFDGAAAIYRSLERSENPSMAALARNALAGLDTDRAQVADFAAREADYRKREADFRQREAEQKALDARRRRIFKAQEADLRARQEIYDLFKAWDDRAALERLDRYGRGRPLTLDLQYAGVFALQRLGDFRQAGERLDAMPAAAKKTPEWLLARGNNERALGRDKAAWDNLSAASAAAEGTPLEDAVRREIEALPPESNLARHAWGELQLDAVYMARFDDTICYGQLREGTFIPRARWIQPFVQLDFTVDSKSGQETGGVSQVYANNLAGGHAGVRLRLVPNEAVWAYALIGLQKDLRDTTRYDGNWFLDWRIGARAYKGFGPGLRFLENSWFFRPRAPRWDWRGRAAWFAEGGADGAYYSLYENFIAYGQLREGFRVLETAGWLGFDVYALQQCTVDSLGLYYNNFGELGAGLRATARLGRLTAFIARLEYLGGAYAGRNADNSQGTLPSSYQDLRFTVSLWSEW